MKSKAQKLGFALSLTVAVGFGILAVLACGSATPAPSGRPEAFVTVGAECPSAGAVTPTAGIAQPDDPAGYPAAIQRYLDDGGDVAALETVLAEWEALPNAPGQVIATDLTGDGDAEIVVALQHLGEAVAPSGDLLVFGRRSEGYVLLYQEGYDPSGLAVRLLPVLDANGDGRQDIVYTLITCGAHTCFESLEILSWEETGFFSLMGGRLDMPHPTYVVTPGRIDAQSGRVASVGAEPQRDYSECGSGMAACSPSPSRFGRRRSTDITRCSMATMHCSPAITPLQLRHMSELLATTNFRSGGWCRRW